MAKISSITNAESGLLNLLIADQQLYWHYAPRLKDEMFIIYSGVWTAFKSLIAKGETINIISLNKEMTGDNIDYLSELMLKISYEIDFETWLCFLEDEIKRQKGLKILAGLNEIIQKEELENIEPFLQNALNDLANRFEEHKTMREHIQNIVQHIENAQSGKRITGFPTGIRQYDNFTGGLQLTDLTIIAGATSQGKTTLALNIIYNVAKENNYVAMFSLEMSLIQLTARLLAIDTGISSKEYLRGSASLVEMNKKLGAITNNKILLDNTNASSLDSIISKMRYFVSRFDCKLFFVDYLQLISFHKKGNSTEQNLADICRTFKNFAKENNISIVMLCQLNRENAKSPQPRLSHLRGSGQIEEAADNVIFITRPEAHEKDGTQIENAKLIQEKGRNSGVMNCDLLFDPTIPMFTDNANYNMNVRL